MRPVNIDTGAQRNIEIGPVYREVYNGSGGYQMELTAQSSFRVCADADGVTVTLDGILAMTMKNGEKERFNVGIGQGLDGKVTVTVLIGAGAARLQLIQDNDQPARRNR